MKLQTKLEALKGEVDCTIKFFQNKHKKTKRRANTLRISSICFSAFITVILGLNTSNQSIDWWFKNIALILGAIVTIINAVDAFFNYGALWIKNSVTLSKVQDLRRKIDFYAAGYEESDISEEKLSEFLEDFREILKDDIKEWLRIREKISRVAEESIPKDQLIEVPIVDNKFVEHFRNAVEDDSEQDKN